MPGINFDPAYAYYDKTRGYAPGVAEAIRDTILNKIQSVANSSPRFLELGVGTGRIALPFIQANYNYVGVDLSLAMMEQLRGKANPNSDTSNYSYHLLQADITRLPFREASFDVALMVHVLHLVDNWQVALCETQRVLRKTGGYLFIGNDEPSKDISHSTTYFVNKKWDTILQEFGINRNALLPGLNERALNRDELIEAFLQQLGAQTERINLLEHTTPPLSPRMMAQRHLERMYSSDWQIPDHIHASASRRLENWLNTECPEPDKAFSILSTFKAIIARW